MPICVLLGMMDAQLKRQLIAEAAEHVKLSDQVFHSFVRTTEPARPFLPGGEVSLLDDLMKHAVQLRHATEHLDETGSPKTRWDAWQWFKLAQTASTRLP
jgi:hypothetical protein